MSVLAAAGFGVPAGLLETALAQAYNAIVLTDADLGPGGCKIVYCNPAFSRMTGYPAAELIGQTPCILQGPLTDPAVLQRLRDCLAANQPFEGRAINYRKGGGSYHVEWKTSPVYNDLGQITHYISVQQDITQLLQAQEMQALLGLALDAAPASVLITDAQQRVIYANRAFADLGGYGQADILGKKPGQLLHSGVHGADFYQSLQSLPRVRAACETLPRLPSRACCTAACSSSIRLWGRAVASGPGGFQRPAKGAS